MLGCGNGPSTAVSVRGHHVLASVPLSIELILDVACTSLLGWMPPRWVSIGPHWLLAAESQFVLTQRRGQIWAVWGSHLWLALSLQPLLAGGAVGQMQGS